MSVFRFRAVLTLAVLPLACVACGPGETGEGLGVVDDFGQSIAAGAPPARIVSLSPATTEILFALGAGPRLVGRTHWDTAPDSATAIPDLGDGIRPNVEAILGARPDLVVLYASEENRDAARAVRAAGASVVSLRVNSIADFARTTRLLGVLVGDTARARTIVDSVTGTLDRVRASTRALPHPSAFLLGYEHPLLAIGSGSFLSELIEIAGGRNVFDDLSGPSPEISFEELLRRNPDVVIVTPSQMASIGAEARWRTLPAIRAGRLLVMDTSVIMRPGVRLGEAAVSLARLLHPGAVP